MSDMSSFVLEGQKCPVGPGSVLNGRFELGNEILGIGGMGFAVMARDRVLEEAVVCKIARPDNKTASESFRAQYRTLRQVRSTGLLAVFGYFEH